MTKEEIRQKVWQTIEREGVRPLPRRDGRIPNFVGAEQAAQLLREMAVWRRALVVKVNPDAPQLAVRRLALAEGKIVYMAVPRLRTEKCFIEIDPQRLGKRAALAASIAGACRYGRVVSPREMRPIDLIVCGSVGVGRDGARVGKGGGYCDLEYGLLREEGKVRESTPILTTVHPLQIVAERIAMLPHDMPVDFLVTPIEVVATRPGASAAARHLLGPAARRSGSTPSRCCASASSAASTGAPSPRRLCTRPASAVRPSAARSSGSVRTTKRGGAAPGGTPRAARSIHAASTPAACAASTSSAKVSPTMSAASARDVEQRERRLAPSAGCGLRSPSASETTTVSTRGQHAVAVQDLVRGAGVVEVAHHGDAAARAQLVEQRRGAPAGARSRPRARDGARGPAPHRASRARRRVAADARERAPEALARRLLDVIAERDAASISSLTRAQRVPERLRAHARRVRGEQRPERADRRADRRRTDAQDRQALGLGEHQGAEEIEQDAGVARHALTAGRGAAAAPAMGCRPAKPSLVAMPERDLPTRRTASRGAPVAPSTSRGEVDQPELDVLQLCTRVARSRAPTASSSSMSARASGRRRTQLAGRERFDRDAGGGRRVPALGIERERAALQRARSASSRRGTSAFASLDREELARASRGGMLPARSRGMSRHSRRRCVPCRTRGAWVTSPRRPMARRGSDREGFAGSEGRRSRSASTASTRTSAAIAVPDELPILPLRGVVIFPSAIVPLLISRGASLKLVEDRARRRPHARPGRRRRTPRTRAPSPTASTRAAPPGAS